MVNERTVNVLQILMFVRVIDAHYDVIYVTFSTTPYKIIGICYIVSFYKLSNEYFRFR